MPKTPLIERMQKGGAAKAWIKEVEAKDREIERLEQTKDQYLNTIDLLAREKEELEAGKDRLLEQLVAGEELYISRGIEIAQLEADLAKTSRAMQAAIDAGVMAVAENAALKRENEAFGDFANTIAYTSDGKRRSSLGLTFTKALEDLRDALLKEQPDD